VVASFERTWDAVVSRGDIELEILTTPPSRDFSAGAVGGDRIRLLVRASGADDSGEGLLLAELDGRHWAFETANAFTGRAVGVYAAEGEVLVRRLRYNGNG
jgi:xylan 1,4-beta-xylosidase